MSNSSQQDHYSITSTDHSSEIVLDSMNTVTIDLESSYNYNSTMSGDYITITSTDVHTFDTQYEIDFGEEWRTHFPDFQEVQKMCEEYPALEKAFENFKTIYEMVKDDYASKTREEDQ